VVRRRGRAEIARVESSCSASGLGEVSLAAVMVWH